MKSSSWKSISNSKFSKLTKIKASKKLEKFEPQILGS
jgi:hypothetical protein